MLTLTNVQQFSIIPLLICLYVLLSRWFAGKDVITVHEGCYRQSRSNLNFPGQLIRCPRRGEQHDARRNCPFPGSRRSVSSKKIMPGWKSQANPEFKRPCWTVMVDIEIPLRISVASLFLRFPLLPFSPLFFSFFFHFAIEDFIFTVTRVFELCSHVYQVWNNT